MGHLSLNGRGIYHLMGGALWYGLGTYGLNGWGSYDKVSCCFVWKYAQKIAGLHSSGEYPSDHRMTTGFGPFELPTCGLCISKLQTSRRIFKGRIGLRYTMSSCYSVSIQTPCSIFRAKVAIPDQCIDLLDVTMVS